MYRHTKRAFLIKKEKLSKNKSGGLRRDGCARRGVDGKSLGRFGRGVLGNQSVNLKDGWFKGQRVQFRVDVELETFVVIHITYSP
jgi:hypothetical protein